MRYVSFLKRFIVEHKISNRFCIMTEIKFYEETQYYAIKAWNNRAETTDLEKMREACSKCPAHARLEAKIEEIMSESE